MADVYESALLGYKDQLFKLYDLRSELVAKRETLRFRLATAYLGSVNTAIRTMGQNILGMNDDAMFSAYKSFLRRLGPSFTLFDMSGMPSLYPAMIRLYNYDVWGHPANVSPNSPQNWVISWDSLVEKNNTVQALMQLATSLDQWENNVGRKVMGKLVENVPNPVDVGRASTAEILGTLRNASATTSDPVRNEFIANTLKTQWNTPLDASGVTMQGIMDEGKVLVTELSRITWDLVQAEINIREVEVEVATFIENYKKSTGYVPGVESASLYEELRAIAEDLNAKALREIQQTVIPVPDSAVPADPVPVVPAVPEPEVATPKKSNLGLVAGLAAAGAIYALTQGEG